MALPLILRLYCNSSYGNIKCYIFHVSPTSVKIACRKKADIKRSLVYPLNPPAPWGVSRYYINYTKVWGDFILWGTPPCPRQEVSCNSFYLLFGLPYAIYIHFRGKWISRTTLMIREWKRWNILMSIDQITVIPHPDVGILRGDTESKLWYYIFRASL